MSSSPRTTVDISMWGRVQPRGKIHKRKWWCYASMPCEHIFGGLLRLSLLSAGFSAYPVVHATYKLAGRREGLFLDSAKPSHVADKLFFLVVPTDGANCCLMDS